MPDQATPATPAEAYIAFYFATRNALIAAKYILADIAMDAPTISEQADAAAKALDTERMLALVENQHAIFVLGPGPLHAPDPAIVSATIALAKKLASDIASSMTTTAIFASVTNSVNALNQFHQESATTAGAPAALVAGMNSAMRNAEHSSTSAWLLDQGGALPA